MLLDAAVIAGMAILLALIGLAIWFTIQMPTWKADFLGLTMNLPEKLADTIGEVAFCVAGIAAVYFLRAGRYNAWVAVQVLGVLGILLAFGQASCSPKFQSEGPPAACGSTPTPSWSSGH